MSSVGVFRKMKMDEKSFLVFTLTQTDNPTSSSDALTIDFGGDDFPPQPFFSCPRARIEIHKSKIEMDDEFFEKLHPFSSSPHFSSTRSEDDDNDDESLRDCDHNVICKLPVVPLFWCNNKEPDIVDVRCGACTASKLIVSYYACLQCERMFHKECVESPLEIKHPSHPFHSLRLYSRQGFHNCICCGIYMSDMFYECTICELSMHPICAMRPIPFVVDHPKSHPHPLTFFPTQDSLVCHICSLIRKFDPTYICIQCVFVIHRDCIGFPHVIRISRHPHRISFTSSLPSRKLTCGLCRQLVDNKYGAYSCDKCDTYFVHSKCALHPKVWDGKDLDGVSEEDDMIDDGEPFERIADGIILHSFHSSHHLRLEISRAYDENKYCRGCALPVYEGQFYSCVECDFILHEACAYAPRMKRHPLHPHPLTLNVTTKGPANDEGIFRCTACEREGTGFFYEHHVGEINFKLDLRCAPVLEPFEYQGHKHPLFLPLEPEKMAECQMCKYESEDSTLNCMECDYIICFRCATLPYKVKYKHDSHFLIICDGKEACDQPDWCEVCEGKIEEVKERDNWWDEKKERRFYKCNECCTTLHVECLLGKYFYMKPGETIKDYISIPINEIEGTIWRDVWILLNSSLTRPICTECMCRCPFPIYFKGHNTIFCSMYCIRFRGTR